MSTFLCGVNAIRLSTRRLELATGFVGVFREIAQEFKELWGLAYEQTVSGEPLDGTHGRAFRLSGTNDGNDGELFVQEYGWFRHDQVLLQCLGVRTGSKVQELHEGTRRTRKTVVCVANRRGITCLVVPRLEVRGLRWTDA